MPSWLLKVVAQRSLGVAPQAHTIVRALKTHVLDSYALRDSLVASRLAAAVTHMRHYRASGSRKTRPFVLELGTGAFPVIALALRLLGSGRVTTLDVQPLLTRRSLSATLSTLAKMAADGRLREALPALDERRLAHVLSFAEVAQTMPAVDVLAAMGIDYRVGFSTDLAGLSASADLIVSHAVLEFVPREELAILMDAFWRVGRKGAVLSHWIDLSDEYAYFDRRLSRLNFLRYPDAVWSRLDNPLCPNFRLRLPDYRQAMSQAGFTILAEEPEQLGEAGRADVPVCRRFASVSSPDIRAVSVWLAARKAPRSELAGADGAANPV